MIRYKEGYLYQTTSEESWETGIVPPAPIEHRYFSLSAQGVLTIKIGFAWDGATSCPEWLVPKECSGVHDAFCQMLRMRWLDYALYAPLIHGLLGHMVAKRRGDAIGWAVRNVVMLARGGHPDNADDNPERCDP